MIVLVIKQSNHFLCSLLQGVNDGAGVLNLASEEAVKQCSLNPLVRLSGWSHAGVAPRIMGLGPVPAIRQLLDATGFTLDDMDMIEVSFKLS